MDVLYTALIGSGAALIAFLILVFLCYRLCCKKDEQQTLPFYHRIPTTTAADGRPTNQTYVTPTYDLHGMTRREAMGVVESALEGAPSGATINIVTGRGLHSQGGVPVIKPAVENYLDEHGYPYAWKHSGGMVSVTVP